MTEQELDDLLSTPRDETIASVESCPGDIIILGAGGKMGPTLARMAARARADSRRVIAVSRWSSAAAERALNDAGVETLRCHLLDSDAVARLPDAANVIFWPAMKITFAASGRRATASESSKWQRSVSTPASFSARSAAAEDQRETAITRRESARARAAMRA